MKKHYQLFLFLIFTINYLNAENLILNSSDDIILQNGIYNTVTINSGGKLTVRNNFKCDKLTIYADAEVIIGGNLIMTEIIGPNLNVRGILIIKGDCTIDGLSKSEGLLIKNTGTMVVGGDFVFAGKPANAKNDGKLYMSNQEDWNQSSPSPGLIADILKLIEDEPISANLMDAFLMNWDGSGLPVKTWAGGLNLVERVWDQNWNWSGAKKPTKFENVLIKESNKFQPNDNTTKKYIMWSLTLQNNVVLEIPEGSQVTIFGHVYLGDNAQIIVNNTSEKPTSFIVHGTLHGEITYKWNFDAMRWWFVGMPIANSSWLMYNSLSENNAFVLYDYQENGFVKISDQTESYDLAEQDRSRGYLFKIKEREELTYKGKMNNEMVYSMPLQSDWQVACNPYASYYQIQTENGEGTDLEHTTGDIYVCSSTSNNDEVFQTFNTVTGIGTPAEFKGIIAPNQGFYIKTSPNKDGEFMHMRRGYRVHDVAKSSLKSTNKKEENIIRITLTNGIHKDEAVIAFRQEGSEHFSRFDSEKKYNKLEDLSFIYMIKDDIKTVINTLPLIEECIINLSSDVQQGDHTIKLSGLNTLSFNATFTLEDKELNTMTILDENNSYSFSCRENETDRFILHVAKNIVTDIEDENVNGVKIYASNKKVHIECDLIGEKLIDIYDVTGKKVKSQFFRSHTEIINCSNYKGIYIIEFKSNDQTYHQKVML